MVAPEREADTRGAGSKLETASYNHQYSWLVLQVRLQLDPADRAARRTIFDTGQALGLLLGRVVAVGRMVLGLDG